METANNQTSMLSKSVLDHGYVRLVDRMGTDLSPVRAARVSYDRDDRTGQNLEADYDRIRSMIERGHTSPFESVVFTFEIHAPIFVFRQWHRHRTWSYNELSARYAPMKELFYVPDPMLIGTQSAKDKQVRDVTGIADEATQQIWEEAVQLIRGQSQQAFRIYQQLLEAKVPKEIARSVLPVNIYSRMYATVDLHNLMHFLFLRMEMHAQYEIRQYAKAIYQIVRTCVPVCMTAWESRMRKWGTENGCTFDLS